MKRFFYGIGSLALVAVCAFFVVIIAYLVSSEVSPALQQGSLNVETSTMILNRVWEGNQIYILLAAYLLLACASAYGAIRFGARVIGNKK